MRLGGLFSGIGGWEFAASMNGYDVPFCAEIEPFPCAVLAKRFPNTVNLGDVSRIRGGDIPDVDVLTYSFPCQSVSVAGKREGVRHSEHGDSGTTRSGLFYEALRIIREMREAYNNHLRFAVFENVMGLLSSGKGEDFARILEEIIGIRQKGVTVPRPQKWEHAGTILGDNWSIAWRCLDSQYWGVPQRRKRIFLIADFGGECAPEILFKSDCVCGDFEKSLKQRSDSSKNFGNGFGKADSKREQVLDCIAIENHPSDSRVRICEDGICQTLSARCGTGGGNVPMVMTDDAEKHGVVYGLDRAAYNQGKNAKFDFIVDEKVMPTMVARGPNAVCSELCTTHNGEKSIVGGEKDVSATLCASDCQDPPVVYESSKSTYHTQANKDVSATEGSYDSNYVVRRLTPTECSRLMGFPDGWVDNISFDNPDIAYWRKVWDTWDDMNKSKHKTDKQILRWCQKPETDAAKYKAFGNGVAIPNVYFILRRIKEVAG